MSTSATILGPAFTAHEESADRISATTDLESTSDLHEENTTDLTPVTEDVKPAAPAPERHTLPGAKAARASDAPGPIIRDASRLQRRSLGNAAGNTHTIDTITPAPPAAPQPKAKQIDGLAPGMVLNDRYLLEQMIGSGGTAVVWRARDMLSSMSTQRNAQIAIKVPPADLPDRERAASRLKHEFDLLSRLSHPNVVRVYDLHDDGERCFMAMELVEGKLLASLIADWTMLSPPLAHKILRDCAQALSHAHSRGVVHGDFKPSNVFLTADEQIKVLDFGAAASTSAADSRRIHAGTPAYASPEVLSGQTPEQRDDVFSFACVAYELLTGQHPFERRSSLQARDEERVPPRAWSLSATQWLALRSALCWERAQRPADIESLLQVLAAEAPQISENAPIHAPLEAVAPGELTGDLMPAQRSWGFFVFIACALVITLIASQRKLDSAADEQVVDAPAAPAVMGMPAIPATRAPPMEAAVSKPAETPARQTQEENKPAATAPAAAAAAPARTAAVATSAISFESSSIVASESSIAAVFLVKRSQPLSGRVKVSWKAVSGSADAGIDFASNASGSVEFADGQAQRAIYVPLRNDLLKEEDESFTVRLVSPQRARVGEIGSSEATIRDDD